MSVSTTTTTTIINRWFSMALVFALVAGLLAVGAEEAISNEDTPQQHELSEENAHLKGYDFNSEEAKSANDLYQLARFCNDLGKNLAETLLPRAETEPEVFIFNRFFALAEHLDSESQRLKRSHDKFACAEVTPILEHELASKYVTLLENVVAGEGEEVRPAGVTLKELITIVTDLKNRLADKHVVNDQVLHDFTNVVAVLEKLDGLAAPVLEALSAVQTAAAVKPKADDAGCANHFSEFVKLAHSVRADELPDWPTLADGVASLFHQCKEHPAIKHLHDSEEDL